MKKRIEYQHERYFIIHVIFSISSFGRQNRRRPDGLLISIKL